MSKKINYHSIGELFCGPGGGGLGASLAKLKYQVRHIVLSIVGLLI